MVEKSRISILGVELDVISQSQALIKVEEFIKKKDSRYIVTPNVEFIVDAQSDQRFKNILNQSDLSLPDSSRLDLAYQVIEKNGIWKKILLLPGFLYPKKFSDIVLSISGIDFMQSLVKLSDEKGFRVGFLGGRGGVARRTADRLKKRFKNLKITLADDGPNVDQEGKNELGFQLDIPETDILFLAFGHIKQEKWIAENLNKVPVKVFMGVGGSFDYLSGQVPRAPKLIRSLGYEWLFRLLVQPWRIRRQLKLVDFIIRLF